MNAIDQSVLDELGRSVGDDDEFLRELVETYLDDAQAQLAAIRSGLAEGNAAQVNRAAHTLKSNSASVGAMDLAEMCRELEALSSPGPGVALEATDSTARLALMAAELERVATDLDALVPPNDA